MRVRFKNIEKVGTFLDGGMTFALKSYLRSIHYKKLPNVTLDQFRYFVFALRLTIAKIDPNGDWKAELCRHNFRIAVSELSLTYQKTHHTCKITHNIRIILPGLKLLKLCVSELFNGQHLAGFTDLRIVQNIAYML